MSYLLRKLLLKFMFPHLTRKIWRQRVVTC